METHQAHSLTTFSLQTFVRLFLEVNMSNDQFSKKIEAIKIKIASERDKIRALINDAETLETKSDLAVEYLEDAADAISEVL